MRTLTRSLRSGAAIVVVGCCVAVAFGVGIGTVAGAAAAPDPVSRTILGETKPSNAPGQDLTLQQVTVQPGAQLPTHFHEGTQVASIRAGVLTYTIESGAATVTHAGRTCRAAARSGSSHPVVRGGATGTPT